MSGDVTIDIDAINDKSGKKLRQNPGEKSKNHAHGWTKNARGLVKLWTVQTALNRRYHQQQADSMGSKATQLKIVGAIFGSLATLISALNTQFSGDAAVSISLNVVSAVCAAIATLVGVILALQNLDQESEKHRQTAIQYANINNEAQTVLIEEHEEDLPKATDFLRRMKDLTHMLQLFGPALEEREDSDLPSMILMRGVVTGTQSKGLQAPTPQPSAPALPNFEDIFTRDSDEAERGKSPEERRKDRAARIREVADDAADIKKRKEELAAEERELRELTQMFEPSKHIDSDWNFNSSTPASAIRKPSALVGVDIDSIYNSGNASDEDNIADTPTPPALPTQSREVTTPYDDDLDDDRSSETTDRIAHGSNVDLPQSINRNELKSSINIETTISPRPIDVKPTDVKPIDVKPVDKPVDIHRKTSLGNVEVAFGGAESVGNHRMNLKMSAEGFRRMLINRKRQLRKEKKELEKLETANIVRKKSVQQEHLQDLAKKLNITTPRAESPAVVTPSVVPSEVPPATPPRAATPPTQALPAPAPRLKLAFRNHMVAKKDIPAENNDAEELMNYQREKFNAICNAGGEQSIQASEETE